MAKRMNFSVVGLPHYTIWHLYEPSVDDLRHMDEMESERQVLQEKERERELGQQKGIAQPEKQQSSQATKDDALKGSEAGPARQPVEDVEDADQARSESDSTQGSGFGLNDPFQKG